MPAFRKLDLLGHDLWLAHGQLEALAAHGLDQDAELQFTAAGNLKRFELSDGKAKKFWEIAVEGSAHTVRYGRIGAKGTSKEKSFASPEAAAADAEHLGDSGHGLQVELDDPVLDGLGF